MVTNVTPLGAYRGAGRPEAAACIERAMDLLAAELGMDPVELRRKNLIAPDAFPYETASGATYDNGEYAKALDRALELADYNGLRAEQAERRARGDRTALGVGVSTYVEITGFPTKEFAQVAVGADGSATVRVGTTSFGQGHETAFAQLVGGVFAIPHTDVRVIHSDTAEVERGQGSWGSRSLQAGGSVIAARAGEVRERARAFAAAALEVDVADVEGPVDGGFHVSGAPERAVQWSALAERAEVAGEPLVAAGVSRDPGATFPFGAHVAVVEVDLDTGGTRLLRLIAVDDCGRILNPMLVRGQQHGGIAQGIAQALFEEVAPRRAREPAHGDVDDLPDALGGRAAVVRVRQHRDADARESIGRERDRRVGHDRRDPGRAERRGRCARPSRRATRRPPVLAGTRLASDRGGNGLTEVG